jgi:hypothetical protein
VTRASANCVRRAKDNDEPQILDRHAVEELSCECYAVVMRYTDNFFPPSVGD